MNAIEIGGKRYITALEAARRSGYTTDYIGQLTRSGKIDGQRIGRIWYVSEAQILTHRKGRSRSNIQKSRESLQALVKDQTPGAEVDTPSDNLGQIHHKLWEPQDTPISEFRKRLLETPIKYEGDATPLRPMPDGRRGTGRDEDTPRQDMASDPSHVVPSRIVDVLEEKDRLSIQLEKSIPVMQGEVSVEEVPLEERDTSSDTPVNPLSDIVAPRKKQRIHISPDRSAITAFGKPSYALARPFITALVPLALVVAFTISLTSVFLEQVLVYERGESLTSRPSYHMSYGLTAVSAIKQSLSR